GRRRSVRDRRDSLAAHYLQSIAGLPRHGYDSTRHALRHTVGVLLSDDPAGDVLLHTYEARAAEKEAS
ncbi:hypothetical protein, partial [Aureimonas sp. AU40]|uniref:hypothetical protein n=1 Tax=Aureimonas sp. AU40 TaxID=1637747 RepID=UPI000A6DE7EF